MESFSLFHNTKSFHSIRLRVNLTQTVTSLPFMEDDFFRIDLTGIDRLVHNKDFDFLQHTRKQFKKSGALWLQGVFDRECMQSLTNAFMDKYMSLNEKEHPEVRRDVGHGDRKLYTVVMEPPFDHPDLYDSPKLFPILQTLLHRQLLIQSFGIVSACPGSKRQPLHVDHNELFEEMEGLGRMLPSYAITVAIPLIDFNEQTGTTAIWPGSHMNTNAVPDSDEEVTFENAVLPSPSVGDCMLWDFRTWHCGTPNLTDIQRPLIYLSVTRTWFEDRCNYNPVSGRYPLLVTRRFLDELAPRFLPLFAGAKVGDSIDIIRKKTPGRPVNRKDTDVPLGGSSRSLVISAVAAMNLYCPS